jgi:hypothetical protein
MFYTYLWLREDGTPYYAGKGHGKRGFLSDGHRVRRPVDREGIITQDFETEADAFEAERFLIAYYGRTDIGTGRLANLTDGGEGPSGLKFSAESLVKLRNSHLGLKQTAESIRKRVNAHKGRKNSEATIAKMKKAAIGRRNSEESCRKMSEAKRGKTGHKHSEATRAKLRVIASAREANKRLRGMTQGDSACQKVSLISQD